MQLYLPASLFEAPPFPEAFVVEYEAKGIAAPKMRSLTQKISFALAGVGLLFLAISYGPSLYYSLEGSAGISAILRGTVSAKDLPAEKRYSYQPAFDSSLPVTNSISISSVGIKTSIEEALDGNYEDALKQGVWRVNDFGTPYNREAPTILAAHRFGYLAWSLDFRLHQSFYNLPKVKEGDVIEIVWRQRKYVYGIYKKEESKTITDYNADLVLYTCEDLTSDIRVIVYAKLLQV